MNGYELKMHGSIMVKKAEVENVKNILGDRFSVRYVSNDDLITIASTQLDAREYERTFMNLYRQLTPHIISANLYFIDYDSDRWNVSCEKGVWKSTPMRLIYDYDRTTVLDVSLSESIMPEFHNPINYHYSGILNDGYLSLKEENDSMRIEGSCYIPAGKWRHNGISCDIYVHAKFLLDGNGNKDITPFIEGEPYFQVKYSYISDNTLVTGWLDQGVHENFSYPDSSLGVLEKDWMSFCSHPAFDSQISSITDFFKRNNTLIIDAVIEEIEKRYPKEYQEYMQCPEEKNQEAHQ